MFSMLRTRLPKSLNKSAFVTAFPIGRHPFATTTSAAINRHTPSMCSTTAAHSSLSIARQLQLPSREKTLRRDRSVQHFWDDNEGVLEQAWKEWNENEAGDLPKIDASILNPALRSAVEAAWANPTPENEAAIKDLWTEVAPGVYSIEFFDMEQVDKLRKWFDVTAEAGIPTRPPYGITLNRKGVMTDPRSVGYLAAPDFQTFYQMLVDEYVRPLGRLFFPESISQADDGESFAFSIQYQGEQGGDKSIRPHSDASTVTFNINFDKSKTWTGSSLLFYGPDGQREVEWAPGHAVMHLGRKMHAALPIESGTRSNWVIWTMGGSGLRSYGSLTMEDESFSRGGRMSAAERWTRPKKQNRSLDQYERWSPF